MEKVKNFFLITTPFVMVSAVLMLIYGDLEKSLVIYFWAGVIVYFFIAKSLFSGDEDKQTYEVKENKNNEDEEFDDVCCSGIAQAQAGILTLENMEYYGMFNMFKDDEQNKII